MRILMVLYFFLCSSFVLALPTESRVPGGLALVPLGYSTPETPRVEYRQHRTAVIKQKGQWLAVIGIPLQAKVGKQKVSIFPVGAPSIDRQFQIESKQYRTQYLTIRDKNKVNPNKTSLQRILREQAIKSKLRETYTTKVPTFGFILPVKGRDTGRFGSKRVINKQPRRPHSGVDLAAPQGTPVQAVAKGVVLYTGDFFFSGKVIYIDHGQGLITLYAHLHKIAVAQGQTVLQGERIGQVGKTGRATGPHLHWTVYLNQEVIDPRLFVSDGR